MSKVGDVEESLGEAEVEMKRKIDNVFKFDAKKPESDVDLESFCKLLKKASL